MPEFSWTCPYCDRPTTITNERIRTSRSVLDINNPDGRQILDTMFIVCPNPKCQKVAVVADLHESRVLGDYIKRWEEIGKKLYHWDLVPPSKARSFPSYIPEPILIDYKEAYLIKDLSPRASATLSRRCLQGIIRDFWGIKPGRLVDEINAIENKVDTTTWQAISAVRKIGNIGAHMEKDINLIVDVDPDESEKLIKLIELLIQDWYINKENRKKQLEDIINTGAVKEAQRKGATKNNHNRKSESHPPPATTTTCYNEATVAWKKSPTTTK
ncbi:MAG: DUF4145 domain-containing protein [Chloroflexi bacterium]|nr:DUF4145 domain-containing protein [Chloroflexota bacterium]MBT7080073.1 DUF4145 domain-containing protein [Chloroflexota bacterium]MBT7290442.1 DUF4145 domain-containing protein [Chloroflexota bacterium]